MGCHSSKKVAMITGASRGLGLALAREFSANDYRLIVGCRTVWPNIDLPDCKVIEGELCSSITLDRFELAVTEFGRLDVLVNNVGVYLNCSFGEINPSDIHYVFKVNLLTPILLVRRLWSIFVEQKHGFILNISSLAASSGGPGESIYSAAKAGLVSFGDVLQFDAVKYGINVVTVNLGAMKTDMTKGRCDWDLLMNTDEVAKLLFKLCDDYRTLRVSSVDVKRRLYK